LTDECTDLHSKFGLKLLFEYIQGVAGYHNFKKITRRADPGGFVGFG